MRAPRKVEGLPSAPSGGRLERIKRLGASDFAWLSLEDPDSDVLRSPVANDAFDRFYIFAPFAPPSVTTFDRVASGALPFRLRVPGPRIGASVTSAPSADPTAERRAYVYTYVTEWGEESAVSLPFFTDAMPTETVEIEDFYDGVAEELEGREWRSVRFYRTLVSATGSDFFFVRDVPWGEVTFVDDVPPEEIALNRRLTSVADNLPHGFYGAVAHPSGAFLAFKGNTIRFSVPFLPHAWPDDFELSVPDQIVALEVFEQNVIVLTDSRTYLLFGDRPPNFGLLTYPGAMPCLSKGTVCSVPGGVIFGTPDGVAFTGREPPVLLSREAIRRDQWRQAFNKPYRAFYSDGSYFGVTASGLGFRQALTGSTFDVMQFEAGSVPTEDRYDSTVYLVSGEHVFEWAPETGPYMDYRWESGTFYSPDKINVAALRVCLDPLPEDMAAPSPLPALGDSARTVLVTIVCDGREAWSGPVYDQKIETLPGGYKAALVQIIVEGQCPVHSVEIGKSISELQNA